ncbi:phosphate ABC transporter permease subunit PstC [bacterium]|nr:phosphate ABC transporter permease subunit PstC [bacterium]
MSGCLTLLIVAFVFWQALPALRDPGVARFVSDSVWRPTDETAPQFGMTPMLVGSGLVTLGAVLLATPLALFSVIVAEFYSSRTLAWLLRRVLELLNGVPSVVFGFWGLVVLVPLINAWHPPGQSLLAGILVLTLMLIPTVALATDASLRAVPNELYRSAAALGIGRGAVVWKLAVPLARRGMVAGVLLGAARAVGETMAIVIVCGNIVQMPDSLFDPVRTITANIALEMGYATSGHRAALFATGLLLMLTSSLFVAGAGLLRRRRGRR